MADNEKDAVALYDLSGLSVLFLEQHAAMRSLMRGVLRELGIGAIQDSATPEQAFDKFNKGAFDLVLTDWAPTLDGMSFLKAIRTDPNSTNPYVPIIVVTAHTEVGRVYTARDLGMTEFLAKPISARLLYGRIRAVIENRRAFVKCENFFGPDRRRRSKDYDGNERRGRDEDETSQMASAESPSQDAASA